MKLKKDIYFSVSLALVASREKLHQKYQSCRYNLSLKNNLQPKDQKNIFQFQKSTFLGKGHPTICHNFTFKTETGCATMVVRPIKY